MNTTDHSEWHFSSTLVLNGMSFSGAKTRGCGLKLSTWLGGEVWGRIIAGAGGVGPIAAETTSSLAFAVSMTLKPFFSLWNLFLAVWNFFLLFSIRFLPSTNWMFWDMIIARKRLEEWNHSEPWRMWGNEIEKGNTLECDQLVSSNSSVLHAMNGNIYWTKRANRMNIFYSSLV